MSKQSLASVRLIIYQISEHIHVEAKESQLPNAVLPGFITDKGAGGFVVVEYPGDHP